MHKQPYNPATPDSLRYRRELPGLYSERLAHEFVGCEETRYHVRLLPNPVRAARGVRLRGWLNAKARGLHRTIRKDLWPVSKN